MKLIQIFKERKSVLLTIMLLVTLTFIYGCQCEGSIGNSSNNTQTINTQSGSK